MKTPEILYAHINGDTLSRKLPGATFRELMDNLRVLENHPLVDRLLYVFGDFPEKHITPDVIEETNQILARC